MVKYEKENDEYAYFTVFMDIFTRYLYTAPLKTLTGQEMVEAFETLIKEINEKPQILRTDQGSEYKSRNLISK